MPGIRWRSWPVPVTIDAAHTGVTDGNAATQSGTYRPSATSRWRTAPTPCSMARSSIAGAIASITHRTSLAGIAWSLAAQDAQPGVLGLPTVAPAPGKPRERSDCDVAERVQQADDGGQHKGASVEVDDQRFARGAVGQARASADDHRPNRALSETRDQEAAEQAGPPGVAVRRERAREQQRSRAQPEARQRRAERADGLAAIGGVDDRRERQQ